jgi:hypothetical protein
MPDYDLLLSRIDDLGSLEQTYRETLHAILREIPPLGGPLGLSVFEKVAQQVAFLDGLQTKRVALAHILETARDEGWPPKPPFP